MFLLAFLLTEFNDLNCLKFLPLLLLELKPENTFLPFAEIKSPGLGLLILLDLLADTLLPDFLFMFLSPRLMVILMSSLFDLQNVVYLFLLTFLLAISWLSIKLLLLYMNPMMLLTVLAF